jgi:hypothetical protein
METEFVRTLLVFGLCIGKCTRLGILRFYAKVGSPTRLGVHDITSDAEQCAGLGTT